MTLLAFTGPAGTGKTTELTRRLEAHIANFPLGPEQRLLALTFMQGARRRLAQRLSRTSVSHRADCMTIDRFAWELVSRWKSRLCSRGLLIPQELDYDQTCFTAARLLEDDDVQQWVQARYPCILVDEFQDCSGGRIGIIQHLSSCADTFIAADEFQSLSEVGPNAAMNWLRTTGALRELTQVHRTNKEGLLTAANQLRNAYPPTRQGPGFRILETRRAETAASLLANSLHWCNGRTSELVILTPVDPVKNPFVRQTLNRVSSGPIGPQSLGPFSLSIEQSQASMIEALKLKYHIQPNGVPVEIRPIGGPELPGETQFLSWVEKRVRHYGTREFQPNELNFQIERAISAVRYLSRSTSMAFRVMTIHQAKNQEFPSVVTLWPLAVVSDHEKQRRLLYNAITRAKRSATVIVQSPRGDRLTTPPFSSPD